MSDQPVQPIKLPLVTRCVGAMPSSDLLGGSEPTIQIQLITLGGQIYLRFKTSSRSTLTVQCMGAPRKRNHQRNLVFGAMAMAYWPFCSVTNRQLAGAHSSTFTS